MSTGVRVRPLVSPFHNRLSCKRRSSKSNGVGMHRGPLEDMWNCGHTDIRIPGQKLKNYNRSWAILKWQTRITKPAVIILLSLFTNRYRFSYFSTSKVYTLEMEYPTRVQRRHLTKGYSEPSPPKSRQALLINFNIISVHILGENWKLKIYVCNNRKEGENCA